MSPAQLILVPTPIADHLLLPPETFARLKQASADESHLILVEEPKQSRRRWLNWGLERQVIDRFIYYNEQTCSELNLKLLEHLKQNKGDVYLISDGGLPAFCDPGQKLVNLCHLHQIRVSACSFSHSVALALALSGFKIESYFFMGFVQRKDPQRQEQLMQLIQNPQCVVLMDTPYRLESLLKQMNQCEKQQEMNWRYFLATDLNKASEQCLRGSMEFILSQYKSGKKEFILIKESNDSGAKKRPR